MSVWTRQAGALVYTMAGLHKLVPPPSRVNANVVPTILALAACAYTPEPPSLSGNALLTSGDSLAIKEGGPCTASCWYGPGKQADEMHQDRAQRSGADSMRIHA